MNDKSLYVCKDCHKFFSGYITELENGCPTCQGPLEKVDVDFSQYSAWPDSMKQSFKEDYVKKFGKPKVNKTGPEKPVPEKPVRPVSDEKDTKKKFDMPIEQYMDARKYESDTSETSGWISGLQIVSWIVFIAFIILGLLGMLMFLNAGSALLGFVILALCAGAGFMSIAMTMVFLGMAHDIRAIRVRTPLRK